MITYIKNFIHVRGDRVTKIRRATMRSVSKSKAVEIKSLQKQLKELKISHSKKIQEMEDSHLKEIDIIQKTADKKILSKMNHIHKRENDLDNKFEMLEAVTDEYHESITKSKTIAIMYNDAMGVVRQSAGVVSGLQDKIGILLEGAEKLVENKQKVKNKIKG